jgi:ribosomal protein S18 acetylase RimI-like enzyme
MLRPVFKSGRTYAIDPDISEDEAIAYWMSEHAYLVEDAGVVLGTYYIRRNQTGGGSHVCNCGFITSPAAQGRGIARAMLEHALVSAPALGFTAMQFNFVLANNTRAIDIWTRAGFEIIGRQPRAFKHPDDGYVDALIMWKDLA